MNAVWRLVTLPPVPTFSPNFVHVGAIALARAARSGRCDRAPAASICWLHWMAIGYMAASRFIGASPAPTRSVFMSVRNWASDAVGSMAAWAGPAGTPTREVTTQSERRMPKARRFITLSVRLGPGANQAKSRPRALLSAKVPPAHGRLKGGFPKDEQIGRLLACPRSAICSSPPRLRSERSTPPQPTRGAGERAPSFSTSVSPTNTSRARCRARSTSRGGHLESQIESRVGDNESRHP